MLALHVLQGLTSSAAIVVDGKVSATRFRIFDDTPEAYRCVYDVTLTPNNLPLRWFLEDLLDAAVRMGFSKNFYRPLAHGLLHDVMGDDALYGDREVVA